MFFVFFVCILSLQVPSQSLMSDHDILATLFVLGYFNNLLTGCQQIAVAKLGEPATAILRVAFPKNKHDHVSIPFIKLVNGVSFPSG